MDARECIIKRLDILKDLEDGFRNSERWSRQNFYGKRYSEVDYRGFSDELLVEFFFVVSKRYAVMM